MSSQPTPSSALPDDPVLLKRLLGERDAEIERLRLLVDRLKAQLSRRRRSDYGASSERFVPADVNEPASPPVSRPQPAANSCGLQRKLPAHLPRESHEVRPATTAQHHDAQGQACGCTGCGGRLRRIGADVAEHLEYVPGSFKVMRTVRPKLACTRCNAIFRAAAPSRPIARGLAGVALLAHVMVANYVDHIPLHRQSVMHARQGVVLGRATMAGWVEQVHRLLEPLVAALGRYVLAAAKLHADDTPVKVLASGKGKTRCGRLWVYVRDDRPTGSSDAPAAWYRFSPDRKGVHPQQHLKGFAGVLQPDAYGGWGELYDHGAVEAACWAHARRPQWNLYVAYGRNDAGMAAQALKRIRGLYDVQADVRGRPAEVRRAARQAHAKPLLAELHGWLQSLLECVSAKSDLAKAARYSLTRWTALTRYVDDGRIEIDNSAAERAMRGIALGRSNYLFMGSNDGGERAASLDSLLQTAKLTALDPEAYLREVLERIAEHPMKEDSQASWIAPC